MCEHSGTQSLLKQINTKKDILISSFSKAILNLFNCNTQHTLHWLLRCVNRDKKKYNNSLVIVQTEEYEHSLSMFFTH